MNSLTFLLKNEMKMLKIGLDERECERTFERKNKSLIKIVL